MNSVDFCFWLQGYFEIAGVESLNDEQVKVVKEHLHLVFKHEIDPLRESETPASKQELGQAHKPGGLNDHLVRC